MHRTARHSVRSTIAIALLLIGLAIAPAAAATGNQPARSPAVGSLIPGPRGANVYVVTRLVSDGSIAASFADVNLVNPWGLAHGVAGPFWVSDNGADTATLYDGDGVANPLVVSLPQGTAPTGVVFHGGAGFILSDGVNSGPARFLFAGEDGRVFGWNPGVPPPSPSHQVIQVHDASAEGVIYKGIAVASTAAGDRLYLTDFHNGSVEVLDGAFQHADLGRDAFTDPRLPDGFAPFGIQNIQGRILVTFAKRDDQGEDDVAGQGLGFVDAFDVDGRLLARLVTRGPLNSPWGMAMAPQGFGRFGGDLLVGNFGDGTINAFRISDDLRRASFDGTLTGPDRRPIVLQGLWALVFGNDQGAGSSDTLFFTSGPGDEAHGLFGKIEAR